MKQAKSKMFRIVLWVMPKTPRVQHDRVLNPAFLIWIFANENFLNSRQHPKVNIATYEKSRRRPTLRYMAPEVVTQSFHPDSFAAYKAADVYGFALVMWEIANRTKVKG